MLPNWGAVPPTRVPQRARYHRANPSGSTLCKMDWVGPNNPPGRPLPTEHQRTAERASVDGLGRSMEIQDVASTHPHFMAFASLIWSHWKVAGTPRVIAPGTEVTRLDRIRAAAKSGDCRALGHPATDGGGLAPDYLGVMSAIAAGIVGAGSEWRRIGVVGRLGFPIPHPVRSRRRRILQGEVLSVIKVTGERVAERALIGPSLRGPGSAHVPGERK